MPVKELRRTQLQCGSLECGKRALGVSALVSAAPQCMWPHGNTMWPHTCLHSAYGPTVSAPHSHLVAAPLNLGETQARLASSHPRLLYTLSRPALPLLLNHFAFLVQMCPQITPSQPFRIFLLNFLHCLISNVSSNCCFLAILPFSPGFSLHIFLSHIQKLN